MKLVFSDLKSTFIRLHEEFSWPMPTSKAALDAGLILLTMPDELKVKQIIKNTKKKIMSRREGELR